MARYILFLFLFVSIQSQGQDRDIGLQYILNEKDIEGAMLFFDKENNEYFTTSKGAVRRRYRPGTMFHLFSTLMFYQLGIVKDSTTQLKWNGEPYLFDGYNVPVWNKDTHLAEAFRNGTEWYFSELSDDIEYKYFKKYIKKSKYGTITSSRMPARDFWHGGRGKLSITMKNQIKFLRRFRANKLPFDKENIAKVKELMLEKTTNAYSLYGKVGTSQMKELFYDDVRDMGWYCGFVETDDNVYYFISYVEKSWNDDREDFFELRRQVVHKGLKHLFDIDVYKD